MAKVIEIKGEGKEKKTVIKSRVEASWETPSRVYPKGRVIVRGGGRSRALVTD